MKEIQPLVDSVKSAEGSVRGLDDNGLRERSNALKDQIRQHVAGKLEEIGRLQENANQMGEDQLEQKESLFEQIDALEAEVNVSIEEVLEEILPEAFAIVKETARRLTENGALRVRATDMDRDIAARRAGKFRGASKHADDFGNLRIL